MTLPIRQDPDPVLREVCAPVTVFDEALVQFAEDMLAAMYDAGGRGLAAPQVGRTVRLFVMDVAWKEGAPDPLICVNPVIVSVAAEVETREERCLSLPGRAARVARPASLRLRWQDLSGTGREGDFDGIAARVVQHEADHLDGVLCIDREEAA